MQSNLISYSDKVHRWPDKKERQKFFIRYNITLETITFNGRQCSDAQIKKAIHLVNNDLIKECGYSEFNNGVIRRVFVVLPILANNYNKTAYVLIQDDLPDYRRAYSCNCNWCIQIGEMCAHILALCFLNGEEWPIKKNDNIIISRGTRKLKAKDYL